PRCSSTANTGMPTPRDRSASAMPSRWWRSPASACACGRPRRTEPPRSSERSLPMLTPLLPILIAGLALLISGLKVLKEFERGVVFRLGRLVGARGPGMIYLIPLVEKMERVDLRTVTMDVPPQDVITKDNV